MFRLVSSGYATPGLTGWGILNETSLDVLLDFTYGMIIEHADEKERRRFDRSLEVLDASSAGRRGKNRARLVQVTKSDGRTITISEDRLDEIRTNITRLSTWKR